MIVNDADSPPDLHLLESFNFSPQDLAPIASLHWAATQESWSPPDLPLGTADTSAEGGGGERNEAAMPVEAATTEVKKDELAGGAATTPETTAPKPPRKNNREALKLKKRRATFEKAREAREDFFRGDFDG